jgi:hypothetical protein
MMPWLNRLAKWRVLLTGWQLGTRPKGDPEADAVRDHRELTLILRAEVSALCNLLVAKGIFTHPEFTDQVEIEARHYCESMAQRFPGVVADDDGLHFDERAVETMKGWKP